MQSLLSSYFLHPEQTIKRKKGIYLFVLGLIIYLYFQLGMLLTVLRNRVAPTEVDDSYVHIIKAVQMQECFFQDAPALNDLRRQTLKPSSDYGIAYGRYIEYMRVFYTYDPLFSAIIVGFRKVGFSWEEAYKATIISGKIAISLALGFWLYVMWGPGPAGIALWLLAFMVFPSAGLREIVPSNTTLGIAFATWGLIIRWRKVKWVHWLMIGAIMAMLLMHPIGRAYALITVGLYLMLGDRPWSRREWFVGGIGVLLVAVYSLLPYLISRPELRVLPDPPPPGWDHWQGLRANYKFAYSIIINFMMYRGGFTSVVVTGFFVAVGFIGLAPSKRKPLFILGVLLCGALAASLFHMLPQFPGDLFSRLWLPCAVLLTGAIANAVWIWIEWALVFFRRIFRTEKTDISAPQKDQPQLVWRFAVFAVLGFFLWSNIYSREGPFHSARKYVTKHLIKRHNHILLDPAQPALLLSRASEGDSVLYASEVPMHFYFTHGAYWLGAVYSPVVKNTPEEETWIKSNKNIRFYVTCNPIVTLNNPIARQGQGGLLLVPGNRLEFKNPKLIPIRSVYLRLENPGDDAVLEILFEDTDKSRHIKSIRTKIPADFSGWLENTLDGDINNISSFAINMFKGSEPLRLIGLRFDPHSFLNWPWGTGISLTLPKVLYSPWGAGTSLVFTLPKETGTEFQTIRFDISTPLDRSIRILDDRGSTVLSEFQKRH